MQFHLNSQYASLATRLVDLGTPDGMALVVLKRKQYSYASLPKKDSTHKSFSSGREHYYLNTKMSTYHQLFLLIAMLVIISLSEFGICCRRSSSRCSRVNCVWHNWSRWGACNHPCGNAGVQSRSRSKRQEAYCGGRGCSGGPTDSKTCNRFCHNRGTPRPGYCVCPEVFWGSCCGHRKYDLADT